MTMAPRVLLDGVDVGWAGASLHIADAGAARGDGAFETIGVWDGRPFRLEDHLGRLQASLRALTLPAVDVDDLAVQAHRLVDGLHEDAVLRIYVTASDTRLLVCTAPVDRGEPRHLVSQPAPWIRPPAEQPTAGAKSMSYGPNMAATRRARAAGGDDALLRSVPEGWLLEGPTFGLAVVVDGVVHVPDVSLGIVDSISRRTLVELAHDHDLEVVSGRWDAALLARADEVLACSSLRGVVGVTRVDQHHLEPHGRVRETLDAALWARRRGAS